MKSRKLTLEEALALGKRPSGKAHPFTLLLHSLEVGESALLATEDWTWRSNSPSTLLRRVERKMGRQYRHYRTEGGQGWVVVREG